MEAGRPSPAGGGVNATRRKSAYNDSAVMSTRKFEVSALMTRDVRKEVQMLVWSGSDDDLRRGRCSESREVDWTRNWYGRVYIRMRLTVLFSTTREAHLLDQKTKSTRYGRYTGHNNARQEKREFMPKIGMGERDPLLRMREIPSQADPSHSTESFRALCTVRTRQFFD